MCIWVVAVALYPYACGDQGGKLAHATSQMNTFEQCQVKSLNLPTTGTGKCK